MQFFLFFFFFFNDTATTEIYTLSLHDALPINIGAVVRAMKNMGLSSLRLVNPVEYDPTRIEGVAHGTRDIVARVRHFSTLADAVEDCVQVHAYVGKPRAAR